MGCPCAAFHDLPLSIPCPACAKVYATRTSLEVHLVKFHWEIELRERSVMLALSTLRLSDR
ncbi:MAG: hypothetical protein ACREBT_01400 [Thermoplasmata archaeon]